MAKESITDEEFDRLETEERHKSLLSALREIAAHKDGDNLGRLETLLVEQARALLDVLTKKEFTTDMRPLVTELSGVIKELQQALKQKPKGFLVKRNSSGLIERIVVEQ